LYYNWPIGLNYWFTFAELTFKISVMLNMKHFGVSLLFVVASTIIAVGQTGVSVNTTGAAPDANSILDISSTDKGVLFPRVADHTTISPTNNSDDGLIVYDTTTDSYWYWDASANAWKEMPNMDDLAAIVVSLDEAYDGGRTITADAGNVEIQGAGHLTVAANVGIGTTTPDEKLEVQFTGRGGILIDGNDGNDAFIQIENGGGSHYIFDDDSDGHALKLESATGREIVFNTDGANERMTVQSDGRVRVNNLADASGAVITSNATGVLGKTSLTGDATDVLLGTGVFGPGSAFSDHDWYQVLSTNIPTGITDWIYTDGRVGIGTGSGTNPSAPLHVVASGAGNPAANSILATNPTNSGGQDAIVTARVAGSSAGDPFFSLDIANEFGWSMGVDNDHDNRFKIAPSWSDLSSGTALTIKTDGNTGIGTTAPTERLTVTGTNTDTYPALGLRSGNDNNGVNNGAQIAFGYNGSSTYQHFIQTRHNSAVAQNAIDFYVSNGTQNNTVTSGSTHVMSMVSGNVGIGTTAPASTLHVSTTQTGNVSKLHNSSLGNNSLVGHEFGKANSTNNMVEFRYNHISDGNSGNWVNLGLWGNANTLNVTGAGNVGVGTTGPIQQLDVNGRVHVNNGVIQRGGAAITGTSDLGLYSRVSGNWMRIVTNNAPIRFFSDDNTGTSVNVSIEANGVLEAQKGFKTERRYGRYRRYQRGGGDEVYIGSWDYCALGGVATRIDNDTYDSSCWDCWESYAECEVQLAQAAFHAWSDHGGTTNDYGYSSRPGWDLRVYGSGPEDAVDVSCIAICVNFDY
jgi:hypothetical protein